MHSRLSILVGALLKLFSHRIFIDTAAATAAAVAILFLVLLCMYFCTFLLVSMFLDALFLFLHEICSFTVTKPNNIIKSNMNVTA